MTAAGSSSRRLSRLRELLVRQVDSGFVPGVVAVLARHGGYAERGVVVFATVDAA